MKYFMENILNKIPLRKGGALVTLAISLILIVYSVISGNDIGTNASNCLIYLVGTTFAIYAASSSYEHVKKLQLDAELEEKFAELEKTSSAAVNIEKFRNSIGGTE